MSLSIQRIAQDISGSEGPLVTKDGRIFMVEPRTGSILEILSHGKKRLFASTGGMPAGLQLHEDGSIWVADMRLGILRVSVEGEVKTIVSAGDGGPVRGCNDCSFDSRGNLYFTSPAGSSRENPIGEVFCRLENGNILSIDSGYAFCNGLAVAADDKQLIVAETGTKRLYGYSLNAPGQVCEKFLFATLCGSERGGPDGMDFDERGRLIVAHWGAGHLEVFTSDGLLEKRIPLPFSKPSNVHFRGRGSKKLLVTEHSEFGLWEVDWECAGQVQFGWR